MLMVHAIVQHELGAPEVLRYVEVADPVAGEGRSAGCSCR
jgi:hypothetical protein